MQEKSSAKEGIILFSLQNVNQRNMLLEIMNETEFIVFLMGFYFLFVGRNISHNSIQIKTKTKKVIKTK